MWADRLTRDKLNKLAFGLFVGAIGGFVAEYFHVPLAWMLGPLFFCMAASVAGLPVLVPMWLRGNFMLIIGLFLGESFQGMEVEAILRWPVSMAGAVLYMPIATWLAYLYYHYLVREDRMTAICSAIPGGLTAVVLISGSLGADERNVALAQSLRIAFVVCMAPVVAFGLMGYAPPAENMYEGQTLISLPDLALLVGSSLALMWLLRNSGIPILPMVCPLIASAVLRLGGFIDGVMPHWLVEVGLLVLGAGVGTRFAGIPLRRLLSFGALTFGGTAVLMGVAAVLAAIVSAITGLEYIALLLAYAPGGVAEMSLIAVAIDADSGFVAVHHIVRIVFVMISVPLLATWVARSREEPNR